MEDIAVVGAGTMGAGIAESAMSAGLTTVMVDVQEEALARGRGTIESNLGRRAEKGRISEAEKDAALGRLSTATALDACAVAPVVVEAVVEDIGIKESIFSDLARFTGEDTILATNTSSLSVARIASVTQNPGRVVGMHFFNPVPAMRLVEIVAGPFADPSSVQAAEEIAGKLGKIPIKVADTPGFVVNRVARPFYLEALRMVEGGNDPAQVDAAIRNAGFRMGPLQLSDLIGMDVNLAVSESLFERYYYHPRFRPSHLQRSMVEAGLLGRKSGRGFYDYGAEEKDAGQRVESGPDEDAALRVISCIVNEAFLAHSEGVASTGDINEAMKLGANYPKGPFEWVEEIGADTLVEKLDFLRAMYGDTYVAAPSLRAKVTKS